MAEFYYATITYASGDKVRVVHKGPDPTRYTLKFLRRIGASIEVLGRVPAEVAHDAEITVAGMAGEERLTANAQFDTPEPDDD